MPDGTRGFEAAFIFINGFLKKPGCLGELRDGDVFSERLEFRGQCFIAQKMIVPSRLPPASSTASGKKGWQPDITLTKTEGNNPNLPLIF